MVRLTVTQAADHQALIRSLEATLEPYGQADLTGPLGVALAASVGQPALMALYHQLAAAVGMEVCQILLSRSDLDSAEAMRDVGAVLISALQQGLLPVVNGNDTTDPKSELDNDQIAVAVAVAAEASRLTFLTNVRAVYGDDAMQDRISRLTPDEARAIRISAAGEGRGGMRSKLNAAARAAYCGVECVIGSARDADVVARSLSPRARMGTVVRAVAGQLAPAERWVGGIAYPMGTIGINREAERSLRAGSTLFLSGVKRVDGEFEPGVGGRAGRCPASGAADRPGLGRDAVGDPAAAPGPDHGRGRRRAVDPVPAQARPGLRGSGRTRPAGRLRPACSTPISTPTSPTWPGAARRRPGRRMPSSGPRRRSGSGS